MIDMEIIIAPLSSVSGKLEKCEEAKEASCFWVLLKNRNHFFSFSFFFFFFFFFFLWVTTTVSTSPLP
jgi:hypothetical protein